MSEEKKKLFEYLEANDHDDLPDGAWHQCLVDAVWRFNNENGTDFDELESVVDYLEQSGNYTNTTKEP